VVVKAAGKALELDGESVKALYRYEMMRIIINILYRYEMMRTVCY
jgi:hypothetical protein